MVIVAIKAESYKMVERNKAGYSWDTDDQDHLYMFTLDEHKSNHKSHHAI